MRALGLGAALTAVATPALAHGAEAATQWTLDPLILAPLALSLVVFAAGWMRLRRRSGHGAGALSRRGLLFAAGWLVLAGAVISPLHKAGEQSFTAHMLEHELMMLVAAPLLVLARPMAIMLWALPAGGRQLMAALARAAPARWAWKAAVDPVLATLAQAAALWVWHAPALFDRALSSVGWHIAQHLSFLVSALLFWTAVLPGRHLRPAVAVLCLFATSVVSGALGAMMAFAQSPWYAGYVRLGLAPLGLSPLEDQQLAGLLMWVPGGLVHALAALYAMSRLLRPPAAEAKVAEAAYGARS
ncbi:cytochrome c oxidase assembly protein [Phenylobacterium sp.]|jgi:putative membrane protein|uniref:cytochrome c oxidase assembly protein n=1 Tax=Phenylobacterium sp. TaxID=1871053 RepID=UPI0037842A7E